LQKDLNGLTGVVQELREWKAAEEVRNENIEKKLDIAIMWTKWTVGTVALGIGGMLWAIFTFLSRGQAG
jgi:cytoskeletal protein RodZ